MDFNLHMLVIKKSFSVIFHFAFYLEVKWLNFLKGRGVFESGSGSLLCGSRRGGILTYIFAGSFQLL